MLSPQRAEACTWVRAIRDWRRPFARSTGGVLRRCRGDLDAGAAGWKAGPRIRGTGIDKDVKISLHDEHGDPVDLSVVHAEVIDPGGRLIRHYSSNLTVRDGAASLQIPFAINDANGTWRVQVRDVISGLTATTSVVRA